MVSSLPQNVIAALFPINLAWLVKLNAITHAMETLLKNAVDIEIGRFQSINLGWWTVLAVPWLDLTLENMIRYLLVLKTLAKGKAFAKFKHRVWKQIQPHPRIPLFPESTWMVDLALLTDNCFALQMEVIRFWFATSILLSSCLSVLVVVPINNPLDLPDVMEIAKLLLQIATTHPLPHHLHQHLHHHKLRPFPLDLRRVKHAVLEHY